MAGLALTGIDPAKHGFVVTQDTPGKIRGALEHGVWPMAFWVFWRQIQIRVPKAKEGVSPMWRDFFDWLSCDELDKNICNRPALFWKEQRRRLKRMLPFGFLCWLRKWKFRLHSLDQ